MAVSSRRAMDAWCVMWELPCPLPPGQDPLNASLFKSSPGGSSSNIKTVRKAGGQVGKRMFLGQPDFICIFVSSKLSVILFILTLILKFCTNIWEQMNPALTRERGRALGEDTNKGIVSFKSSKSRTILALKSPERIFFQVFYCGIFSCHFLMDLNCDFIFISLPIWKSSFTRPS